MEEKSGTGMFLIAIVAIVAVVGLVVLFLSMSNQRGCANAMPSQMAYAQQPVVLVASDDAAMAGQVLKQSASKLDASNLAPPSTSLSNSCGANCNQCGIRLGSYPPEYVCMDNSVAQSSLAAYAKSGTNPCGAGCNQCGIRLGTSPPEYVCMDNMVQLNQFAI